MWGGGQMLSDSKEQKGNMKRKDETGDYGIGAIDLSKL